MELNVKRVFCGQCRFYSEGFSDTYYEFCDKAKRGPSVVTYRGIVDGELETPAQKNANNDCSDFKPINRQR